MIPTCFSDDCETNMLTYDAFVFRQVAHGPVQLTFVATSAEIDRWAKVPTKMSRRPKAFQRPAIESHVSEVQSFFQDSSKANSSPTAIILGFEPESASAIRILQAKGGEALDPKDVTTTPRSCWVEIDFEPWPSKYSGDLSKEISELFEEVKYLYPEGDPSPQDTAEYVVQDDPSEEDDEDEEQDDGDEDEPDREEGQLAEADEPKRGRTASPEQQELARIKAYFDGLTPGELARICRTSGYRAWPLQQQERLRDLLKDDRKPGLIIDGQHRVKGTLQARIPFIISFLPGATWAELAFQFIVNNGSAKKVSEGLLISIVGESLAPEELRTIEQRLYRAKIRVSLIQAVMRVQESNNPFSGMLEFNIPGEAGFLEAPAMQKKVVKLWYGARDRSGNTGRFASLKIKNRNDMSMKEMFAGSCSGVNAKERVQDWQDQQKWFQYFAAFWRAIAGHFHKRLWPQSPAQWPSKSKQSSPADKERLKLMRVTVLGILQEAVLVAWSTDVIKGRKRKGETMEDFKITPAAFEAEIAGYIKEIPDDFFTEITYTGFDGSPSLRDDLRSQMLEILEGRKEFAAVRATHKFWSK